MTILGIDPGLSGALAFYDGTTLRVYAVPVVETIFVKNGKKKTRNDMDLLTVCDLIRKHRPERAVIERVSAMKGQGVTGMFRFGCNYGQYHGILAALNIPFDLITPQRWKKHFDLDSDKNKSLELARLLFPANTTRFRLKKHDGLAEAALIRKYAHDLV